MNPRYENFGNAKESATAIETASLNLSRERVARGWQAQLSE